MRIAGLSRIFFCIFLVSPIVASAQSVTAIYDFTVTNLQNTDPSGAPSPVDAVSGSFGLTFTPSDVNSVYEIRPDLAELSILNAEYTPSNTLVQVNDGDVIALVFGGENLGAAGRSFFTNDFVFVVFIIDSGELYLPEFLTSFVFNIETSSENWFAQGVDIQISRRTASPATLVSQLADDVTGIGPGSSLLDKLIQVSAYVEAEDTKSACEMMMAFENQVAAQRGKSLSEEQASQFLEDAESIISALGCIAL